MTPPTSEDAIRNSNLATTRRSSDYDAQTGADPIDVAGPNGGNLCLVLLKLALLRAPSRPCGRALTLLVLITVHSVNTLNTVCLRCTARSRHEYSGENPDLQYSY